MFQWLCNKKPVLGNEAFSWLVTVSGHKQQTMKLRFYFCSLWATSNFWLKRWCNTSVTNRHTNTLCCWNTLCQTSYRPTNCQTTNMFHQTLLRCPHCEPPRVKQQAKRARAWCLKSPPPGEQLTFTFKSTFGYIQQTATTPQRSPDKAPCHKRFATGFQMLAVWLKTRMCFTRRTPRVVCLVCKPVHYYLVYVQWELCLYNNKRLILQVVRSYILDPLRK